MKPIQWFVSLALAAAMVSCAASRKDNTSPAQAAGKAQPPAPKSSRFAAWSKLPAFSLTDLLPGPKVKVVKVRHNELKEFPTGHERALAWENKRRGFWIFGGPVDFKEPTLPEPGSELDGSLLPPRLP